MASKCWSWPACRRRKCPACSSPTWARTCSKIDTPTGEPEDEQTRRRAAFAYVNRNKRSLALNLKAPEGQAVLPEARRQDRRARRGISPRRDEAPWRGLRDALRAEPADRVLLALRLRPERAVSRLSGSRRQLPVAGRRPRADRRAGQEAGLPPEPGRRLRGREHARGARRHARAVRAGADRPGPARGRVLPGHVGGPPRRDAQHALLLERRLGAQAGRGLPGRLVSRTTRSTRPRTESSSPSAAPSRGSGRISVKRHRPAGFRPVRAASPTSSSAPPTTRR